MRDLNEAIERLYQAFSEVPKPHQIDGCPHCIEYKRVDVLLGKPLRELTPKDLASYSSSAFLTVGDVADYLYFLPRILEITATELGWYPGPEVTGGAIRSAQPDNWAAAQRTALNDYLVAVVDGAIRAGDYDWVGDWICGIGRMGFDVRPYLGQIAKDPAAVLAYFEENAESLPRRRLSSAFWELPCPAHDAVVEWFYSPEIARIPFEAYGYALIDGLS